MGILGIILIVLGVGVAILAGLILAGYKVSETNDLVGMLYLRAIVGYALLKKVSDQMGLRTRVLTVDPALKDVVGELEELILANKDFFFSTDPENMNRVEKIAKDYKVSEARQKELSKARYGIELTVDDLIEEN